ncbi:uncharacterized protein LOC131067424 [Cryptomeria japonica]|uniref:uncharacterized protein LOC131067424 n=1 Tax=Cryptomeria japonica TaxID=3369 RepID=UPI0025ABA1FF|nr:uncharacterized protein LOC131067424 [Cryptomeria japonica]
MSPSSSRLLTHFNRFISTKYPSGSLQNCRLPSNQPAFQINHYRFLDIYQFTDKEAIKKERARLGDELNRGYFADISELNKHGGKIGFANKTLIPTIAAKNFPTLVVEFTDGRKCSLPGEAVKSNDHIHCSDTTTCPNATLICLSFRANSQAMIDSWSSPFLEAFKTKTDLQLYEVSFIDSWLLSLRPIKSLLLRTLRKSEIVEGSQGFQRQIVYSFGDNYDFRKELKILNLLTGYIFLLDNKGRIRWQGFGTASDEEVSSMITCTSLLLKEQCK